MRLLSLVVLFFVINNYSLKLDRVIISSDTNPMYSEFWPLVAQTWQEIIGIKPTLIFIAPSSVPIDQSCGDVIRMEPIDGIETSFQAQIVRLLAPAFFPDETCIISDIDILPLNKHYFTHPLIACAENDFLIYRDGYFSNTGIPEYPMCYVAGKGKTFQDIFCLKSVADIPDKIREWYALNLGWSTDQRILYAYANTWKDRDTHLKKLGHTVSRRIDRADWNYNKQMLTNNYYVDAHMLRPYHAYKKEIDLLADEIGIAIVDKNKDLYIELLKRCLTGLIYYDVNYDGSAFNEQMRNTGRDWPLQAHTMIGLARMNNLQFCVEEVIKNNVPGDFIETGVWRGGAVIFMRGILKAHGITDRMVWAADSFQGLPVPNLEKYPADYGLDLYKEKFLAVSLDQVKANCAKYDLLDDHIKFLPGWFKDTLNGAAIEKLAILRLDGDLYESTMDALTALYHKLSVGGYIIIDDYSIPACQAAVHDFRHMRNISEPIMDIDGAGAYWQKIHTISC